MIQLEDLGAFIVVIFIDGTYLTDNQRTPLEAPQRATESRSSQLGRRFIALDSHPHIIAAALSK
ncbi:MAG: hypothetical protein CL985_00035 [Euryarchaeota archaeon]|nr:hypothetical protein [Euryarchaeota archaeon]